MEQRTFTTLDIGELKSLITDSLKETLAGLDFLKPKEQTHSHQYLSRQDTAKILLISLPTLDSYTRQGLIKAFRIGNSIRYLMSDVLDSLTLINVGKR